MGEVVLEVKNLTKYYISGYFRTKYIVGAEDVTFNLRKGEIFSLVGQSGSGKTTVAKMVLRLIKPTKGEILLHGKDAFSYPIKDYYRMVQAVFQDPFSSVNFFFTVDKIFADAFKLAENTYKKYSAEEKNEIIQRILEKIGMEFKDIMGRYPHQLSGGQLQRLLVARALIISPDVLVVDEPTSMIDASTRVGLLNEVLRLKEERGMAVIFITHDIGQAYYISDRVAVMYKGRIVEEGPADKVFFEPEHPYTKDLIASVPKLLEKWSF
ncbi:MAG: ATP-binding cassette domain-containing protein [Candidatus Bathyarchaeia archaeon]